MHVGVSNGSEQRSRCPPRIEVLASARIRRSDRTPEGSVDLYVAVDGFNRLAQHDHHPTERPRDAEPIPGPHENGRASAGRPHGNQDPIHGTRRESRPALRDAVRSARAVDGKRRVCATRSQHTHKRREPTCPPARARTSNDVEAENAQCARLKHPIQGQAHEHYRRAAPAPREEWPLRPVKERQDPWPITEIMETRIHSDVEPQRRQPKADDHPEHEARARACRSPPRGQLHVAHVLG